MAYLAGFSRSKSVWAPLSIIRSQKQVKIQVLEWNVTPYCMTSVINYLFVNWVFFKTVKCESNFAIHLKNIVVQNYAWAHWSIQCNVQYWRILNACMMWKYSREHIQCIVYICIYIYINSMHLQYMYKYLMKFTK